MNRRAFKAIFRQVFGKKGTGGAEASRVVFLMSIFFVVALMFAGINLFMSRYIRMWEQYKGYHNVIVVNCPVSAEVYLINEAPDLRDMVIHLDHDAEYDATYFATEMRQNKAFMAIVFPRDFDEAIEAGEQPEILTFVLTDRLDYVTWQTIVVDEPLWFYQNFLKTQAGFPTTNNESASVVEIPISLNADTSEAEYIAGFFGQMMIPLVTFIGALYICMSKGTNSISWQKENNVFTGIIMTPIKPLTIVTGNLAGIWLSSLLPALIIFPLIFLIPFYRSFTGPFIVLLYLATLTLFISALTLLISILNDSVVSAQTAFLPIFFILISVCVMCIQGVGSAPDFYFALPVYGHFYGIGNALTGNEIHIPSLISCLVCTLLLTGVCVYTSVRLLGNERFTACVESYSDKEARKARRLIQKQSKDYLVRPRACIFGYVPRKRTDHASFIADHIFYPLAILSLFQTLAMIPALIHLSKSSQFSESIAGLRGVDTVLGVTGKTFEFFGLLMSSPFYIICMVAGYIGIIAAYILRVRWKEKNDIKTIGLSAKIAFKQYAQGLLIGFAMISSVYILLSFTGNVKITGLGIPFKSLPLFFAYILMWIPQGASEEIMFRGFIIPRVAARYGTPFAVFFSSLMFGVFHAANKGFTVLALINLMLIATAFALIALYKEHIWTVCAAHSIWNFSQGNLYGLEVSGNTASATVLHSIYPQGVPSYITGGEFGPEGGIFVTVVSIVVIGIMCVLLRKKHGKTAVSGDSGKT